MASNSEYFQVLHSSLLKNKNDENAEAMSKYMKNLFSYFGIKSEKRKALFKVHVQNHGLPEDWRNFVKECWLADEREMQYIGMELALKKKRSWIESDLALFKEMIVKKSWWDTVDFIASNLIGNYAWKWPEGSELWLNDWNQDEDMWLNRTSILYQLKYKDFTNFKQLQTFIHRHKYSNEFFLQKAIGWALRQYARTDAEAVQAFVTETELKPLSRREALKNIS